MLILAAIMVTVAVTASLFTVSRIADAQSPTLEWTVAERDDLDLWHWQGQERTDVLADSAQGAYELVSDLFDVAIDESIILVIWPADTDPSDRSMLPPELADAEIVPVLRNTSGEVRNAVTDQLINAATGQHADDVPLWMRLGLGLWSQGPMPGFYLRRAGSVVVLDHEEFYSVEQLQIFPQTWQFQAKYLGQVGGMIAWFIQDWGPESISEVFGQVGDGQPFYTAIEQVYGLPEDKLISEFTKNAERALLLTWPYIEAQTPPFHERLNINYIIAVAAAIPLLILFFFIGKRLFYD